jgi:hypothetical protein
VTTAIGLLGGRVSVVGSRGVLLCCIALSASEVSHLTAELRQCARREDWIPAALCEHYGRDVV